MILIMKKILFTLIISSGVIAAQAANVPTGLTGLWLFQTSDTRFDGTIGGSITTSHPDNGTWMTGPWVEIGTDGNPGLYSGNGVIQDRSWDYLTVPTGIAPNGGGSYVNNYTILIDYNQTQSQEYNSLFQTAGDAHANDGDLWIKQGTGGSSIGSAQLGYSALTFDPSTWHRIVWSVQNDSFFRVYIDGTLFLDSGAQGVDGRYSLNPTFYLFADNDWEDAWGLVGTVAVWDHALTGAEITEMGGWVDGAATPTPLTLVPEPTALSFLATGALLLFANRNAHRRRA